MLPVLALLGSRAAVQLESVHEEINLHLFMLLKFLPLQTLINKAAVYEFMTVPYYGSQRKELKHGRSLEKLLRAADIRSPLFSSPVVLTLSKG